ncbi:MAG: hypothetical protein DRG24_00030 [Epsilonproteobacteria bacterium]|nr:MAG: hypothetical protein DRG24_00030 [Campylobacterota bacterium]
MTPDAEDLFKNWEPEVLEYDPEVDGSEEHMIRDEMLDEKERLKDVITQLKEKSRGDRKVRR